MTRKAKTAQTNKHISAKRLSAKRLALAAKSVKATYAVIYETFDMVGNYDSAIIKAASNAYASACKVHMLIVKHNENQHNNSRSNRLLCL